jgi:hypothetical protein
MKGGLPLTYPVVSTGQIKEPFPLKSYSITLRGMDDFFIVT